MENISYTDRVRNEEVLHSVKKERYSPHTINTRIRKANWMGHISRRKCLVRHVTEGKIGGRIEGTGRRKKLLDDLQERRGYWKSKEEALDRALWRTRFTRGYGPVVRQTTE
jgi:hypothetical protein